MLKWRSECAATKHRSWRQSPKRLRGASGKMFLSSWELFLQLSATYLRNTILPLVENRRTQYNVIEDLVWKLLSHVNERNTVGNLLEERKGTMQQHSSEESVLNIQMENCIQDCL